MKREQLKKICITAIMTALSLALSYFKIPIGLSFGGFGGSIDCVMIPIIICGYYFGLGYGLITGLLVGTIKFLIGNSFAISWASILLDYSLAYMLVGLCGIIRKKQSNKMWLSALIGCVGRFIIHFISGITIYSEYMSDILGMKMTNVWVYSTIYNGTYMLPNTILAVLVCLLLERPLIKLMTKISL